MFKSCLKVAATTIGAFSLISLSACSNDEPAVPSTPASSEKSEIRSVEDACNIALAFLEAGKDISASRSEGAIANVKIGYGASSRSGAADTLFYSINLANDGGFVLVSAPVAAEPVLAFVENGSYDPAQTTDNPGFNMFIEKSKEYISISSIEPGSPGGPVPVKKPYTLVRDAKPKLNVKWGVHYPEGLYCKNGHSGCVQTAIAQILSYFEQPTYLNLTYSERDREYVELNWAEIKKHKVSCYSSTTNSHLTTCEATEEIHKVIAYLCRELGHRNNADYSKPITYASSFNANNLLKSLLPNKTITDYTNFNDSQFSELISKLVSNKALALFRGNDVLNTGHAWVCEGGRYYEHHTEIYFANGEEDVRKTYYFYFNWGDNGNQNGYFLGDVYDPFSCLQEEDLPPYKIQFNPLSRAEGYAYNVNYYMIF